MLILRNSDKVQLRVIYQDHRIGQTNEADQPIKKKRERYFHYVGFRHTRWECRRKTGIFCFRKLTSRSSLSEQTRKKKLAESAPGILTPLVTVICDVNHVSVEVFVAGIGFKSLICKRATRSFCSRRVAEQCENGWVRVKIVKDIITVILVNRQTMTSSWIL